MEKEKDPLEKRDKKRETDRVLVLKIKEGEKVKTSGGLMGRDLFTGENNLHLVLDLKSMLWYFKYDRGGLPEPLKQRFTSYDIAYRFAEQYLARRNIEIEKVID